MKVGIIVGSIRDGRKGGNVAKWVEALAARRDDADFVLVDLKEFGVPLLTTGTHPMQANRSYDDESVQHWSEAVDACDAFVFVTPEYNHGVPGGLKNAVDSLGPEWVGKAIGFVSYGSALGSRAVEQWRQVVANFSMVDVRAQVALSLFTDLEADGTVRTSDRLEGDLGRTLDELVGTAGRLTSGS